MPVITYVPGLKFELTTHGLCITCPTCGSLDEVNYNLKSGLYMCAFDGTVFDQNKAIVDIEVGPYELDDESGWVMNVIC